MPKAKLAPRPKEIADLAKPWNSRSRTERAVLGAIDLAFMRGYQAGYEDADSGKEARYYARKMIRRDL